MNGTWKVTGGGGGSAVVLGVGAVAAAVAVELLASLLAALLWILVVTAAVVVVALVVGIVLLRRRYNPDRAEPIGRQGEALRAYAGRQAVEARPTTVIHYHGGTHVHVEAGATAEVLKWPVLPLRDVGAEIKED